MLHQTETRFKEVRPMKFTEIIRAHYTEILDTMIDRYEKVLEADGRSQYDVYIWSDGEIECLLQPQGGNTRLAPYDSEPREICKVLTVTTGPAFDLWDAADHSAPEDEDQRAEEEAELREWLLDAYKDEAETILDDAIEVIERDEE